MNQVWGQLEQIGIHVFDDEIAGDVCIRGRSGVCCRSGRSR